MLSWESLLLLRLHPLRGKACSVAHTSKVHSLLVPKQQRHGARQLTTRMPAASGRCKHTAAAHASSSGYWTLAEPFTLESEVKKSVFIATAWPVSSAAQALSHIQEASDASASHNCWAFKVAGTARSNDDGKPILGAIEGDGLDGVAVLVVRHFGGVKLGAGGLVRAYGGAARDCIRAAPKAFVKQQCQLAVVTPFESLGTVYNLLAKYGAAAGPEDYSTANGRVQLTLTVDAGKAEELIKAIADATSGKVQPSLVQG